MDQPGNVVYEKEIIQSTTLIKPSGLAAGLYFIQVKSRSGEIKTNKLIIQ